MPTRVLIADDESLAREGLESLVCDLDGFQVVAIAHDGRSAIAMAKSTRPDICILDIRMPGLNGLETLRAIREHDPCVRCIIYSGHDDFGFAQTAIRLKADDYLLKPASRETVASALRRVQREARYASSSATPDPAVTRQLATGLDAVEEVFYRNLLRGDVPIDGMAEQRAMLAADSAATRVLMLSLDDSHQIRLTSDADSWHDLLASLRAAAQRVCEQVLGRRGPLFIMDGEVLVVLGGDDSHESFPRFLRHEVQMEIRHDVSVAVGDDTPLAELSRSYKSAKRRLGYRLALGGRRVVGPGDDIAVSSTDVESPAALLELMKKSVRYADRTAVDEEIGALIAHFQAHAPHPDSWRRFCFQIYEECHFLVRECVPNLDNYLTSIEVSRGLQEVSTAGDLNALLRSSLGELMDILDATCRSYSLPLKKALDYIDRNYATEFSLRDLAGYVHLNPSYLSNLISRESGRTFVEHVTERRITKAKELLSAGTHNVSEVAYELGYETPRYFSMVFKKWTGTTPREYQRATGIQARTKEY